MVGLIGDFIGWIGQSQVVGLGNKNFVPTLSDMALHKEWMTYQGYGVGPTDGQIVTLSDAQYSNLTSGQSNAYKPLDGSLLHSASNRWVQSSGRTVIHVRCAFGGSALMAIHQQGTKGHWDTASGVAHYPNAVIRINRAMQAWVDQGNIVGKVVLIWSQGYADAKNGTDTSVLDYSTHQAALLERFRADLDLDHPEDLRMYMDENYAPRDLGTTPAIANRCNIIKAEQYQAMVANPDLKMAFKRGLWVSQHASSANRTGWLNVDLLHFGQKGLDYFGGGVNPDDPDDPEQGIAGYAANDQFGELPPPVDPPPGEGPRRTSHIAYRLRGVPDIVGDPPPPPGDPASYEDAVGAGVISGALDIIPVLPDGSGGKIIAFSAINNVNIGMTPPDPAWLPIPWATKAAPSIASFEWDAENLGEPSSTTFHRAGTGSGAAVVLIRVNDAGVITNGEAFTGSGDVLLPSVHTTEDGTLLIQVALRLVSTAGGGWNPPVGATKHIDEVTAGTPYQFAVGSQLVDGDLDTPTRLWDNITTGASKGIVLAIAPIS